ncbi:hypothetical protein ABZ532_29430 [Streptomyces sp. NPDC019396]|uniref:hypothetical protein n=1 Tax=Streptomyces sp. NPDC019396 TaxID=3154687 RepID=UPI003408F768
MKYYALVPDASAIHDQDPWLDGKRAQDPWLDGKRAVVACSAEHLAELVKQYESRPCEKAGLWAAKIARVLEAHSRGLSVKALTEQTGLDQSEIELGIMWMNAEFHRQHPRLQDLKRLMENGE